MPTTLVLARHGQTADNANHVFQGQGGKGLDERGRAQARHLAARLARHDAGITAIVSSDLERAVETARFAATALALEPTTDLELREIDVGAWTGKSYREIEERYPEEWAAWNAGLDIRRGGGETYAELAERIDRALVRIARANEGGRVLVVSHGGAIRSWVSKLLGLGDVARRALGGVSNTAVTVVEFTEASSTPFRLHTWNDAAHLEGAPAVETSD